ncbi:protein Niban 1 [Pangasianodon hypophthalmus]|uniref:protein Niban 1 n=1 Tax=Pangasianodon hypophthalmus TaxID=310915 RepID=UPI0023080D37|nr:protein Niban 1 [Pangasianodon hypophthalmus]
MGVSSSSLLDETKCNYIRGRTEAELNNFSPHYKRQYCVAFFSQLQDEVEQQQTVHTQLLKQKEPPQASDLVYKDSVLHFDDSKKWKERFATVRADYSLELHDSQETFAKGTPARQILQLTGGTVLTSEEKYCALVDKTFPDLNSSKEEAPSPMVTIPGPFPVFLRLPYRRDVYFSFQEEDKQIRFVSILSDCIRHQNHDSLKKTTCEVQAFLKAIHFYRQEKGHYESWEMLVGTDCQVLANLVMEELLPSLQTELLPRLKGKKAERKRVWFTTVEATYELVQEQLSEGLQRLKDECSEIVKQQETLIRSDMDQIVDSSNFLKSKLQGLVSEPAMKFCSDSVSPYLASILEELMGPVSSGFQAVRQRLETELSRICKDFQPGGTTEELTKALEEVSHAQLEDCYQHVSILKEQLQELRSRFKFSNSTLVVHKTQSHMQQLMENAVYTFELLLQSAMKDEPEKLATVMEKAKLRVLKQYDYDSSTVRKMIFQEALVDITLPAIRRNLAPSCKTELQKYEQYIFADYTNFIQVENVYEDIMLNTLNNEVNKVVKEAATLKKHNLFVDSTELQCLSQSSLTDSRTPPRSAPSSPAKVQSAAAAQKAEQVSSSLMVENGSSEKQPVEKKQEFAGESSQRVEAQPSTPSELSAVPSMPSCVSADSPDLSKVPSTSISDSSEPMCEVSMDKPDMVSCTSLPEAADATAQSQAMTSTVTDFKTSPVIIVSEPESLADQTISGNLPIEVNTESPVPPASVKENQSVNASEEIEVGTAIQSHSEICDAVPAPPEEPHSGTVQPDTTNAENPSGSQTKDTDDTHTETLSGDSSPPIVDTAVSETAAESVMESSTTTNTNGLPSIPDLPAGGDLTAQSATVEPEGTTGPHRDSFTEDQEAEEPLDSVKSIRDLVVEIIEVEDIVTPCPDSRGTQ